MVAYHGNRAADSSTAGHEAEGRSFLARVSEGLELHQLWSQFEKDARSSYRLYSSGLKERQEEQSWWHRSWYIAKALFWAVIEKLSPARRVLLLVGLILLFLPTGGGEYTNDRGHIEVFNFDTHMWGGLVILLVLLLELADRVVMKHDLEIAKDIQSWLLPGAPLQIPGYGIAYATRPANTVAGDYYDVILRPGASRGTEPGFVRSGRRGRKEHSCGDADGDLPGQSADIGQQSTPAGPTGERNQPLCLFKQPGRKAVYDRLPGRARSGDG